MKIRKKKNKNDKIKMKIYSVEKGIRCYKYLHLRGGSSCEILTDTNLS